MIVYSLAKWKEITSKGASADQVADILQSWEAQNKMLHWELLQLEAFIEGSGVVREEDRIPAIGLIPCPHHPSTYLEIP